MTGNEREGYGKTRLAEEILSAGLRTQYDTHAKRLLSAGPVLARILQKTVEECAGFTAEQIMAWIDPEIRISSEPVEPGKDRTRLTEAETRSRLPGEGAVTYDIRFHMQLPPEQDRQENGKRLLFDLEAQESYDKLSVILICLNEQRDRGEPGSLYHFLNTLLSSRLAPEEKLYILEEQYGISMQMKIREELEAMCNLSEAIEERAMARGMECGIEQGIERGSFIAFCSLVKDGLLKTDEAARRMKMSEEAFVERMREENGASE